MITSKLPPATQPSRSQDSSGDAPNPSRLALPRRFQEDKPAQSGVIVPVGSDFEVIDSIKRNQVIMVYGPGQTGKTTFALKYAREPVAQINFDGRDTVAHHEARAMGRKIMRVSTAVPPKVTGASPADVKRIASSIASTVTNNIEAACESSMRGNVGTICLDTGTEFHQILNQAEHGADKLSSNDWDSLRASGRIKEQWWSIIRMVQSSNANLIVLAREKKIYKDKEDTGKITYDCPKVIFDAADIVCEMRIKTITERRVKSAVTEIEVIKAGNNRSMLWTTWTQDGSGDATGAWGDNPFVFLCTLLTPGSSEEDWS